MRKIINKEKKVQKIKKKEKDQILPLQKKAEKIQNLPNINKENPLNLVKKGLIRDLNQKEIIKNLKKTEKEVILQDLAREAIVEINIQIPFQKIKNKNLVLDQIQVENIIVLIIDIQIGTSEDLMMIMITEMNNSLNHILNHNSKVIYLPQQLLQS